MLAMNPKDIFNCTSCYSYPHTSTCFHCCLNPNLPYSGMLLCTSAYPCLKPGCNALPQTSLNAYLFIVESIATDLLGFLQYQLILLHTHYMFRPLRTIFRWIIYTSYSIRNYFSTTYPLFALLVIGCIGCLCFGDFSLL
jgi:hypothetical protein